MSHCPTVLHFLGPRATPTNMGANGLHRQNNNSSALPDVALSRPDSNRGEELAVRCEISYLIVLSAQRGPPWLWGRCGPGGLLSLSEK